jgi:hypothetical protein
MKSNLNLELDVGTATVVPNMSPSMFHPPERSPGGSQGRSNLRNFHMADFEIRKCCPGSGNLETPIASTSKLRPKLLPRSNCHPIVACPESRNLCARLFPSVRTFGRSENSRQLTSHFPKEITTAVLAPLKLSRSNPTGRSVPNGASFRIGAALLFLCLKFSVNWQPHSISVEDTGYTSGSGS